MTLFSPYFYFSLSSTPLLPFFSVRGAGLVKREGEGEREREREREKEERGGGAS